MSRYEVRLKAYEPRWHGFSKWEVEEWSWARDESSGLIEVTPVYSGFVRRRSKLARYSQQTLPFLPSRTTCKRLARRA